MNVKSHKAIKLTIGRLARAADVSVETVRYYHRRGLLHQPKKPAIGGFRCYDENHLCRLWLIKRAKELGFTLAEILDLARHVEQRNCDAIRLLGQQKIRAIRQQIRLLEKARQTLRTLIGSCPHDCPDACPVILDLTASGIGGIYKR